MIPFILDSGGEHSPVDRSIFGDTPPSESLLGGIASVITVTNPACDKSMTIPPS
ncbi:hypothetical protein LOC67_12640 [Stieleria sp. JC731]|uniref:hypothetical protein n=1 Tax=Pirellulaceae TaxID=2691357 RepID=UPI001E52D42D|nr:hypothetical protein [Stieleria sp. JC731]MCC9601395.1 hypothetical protein [Stieleria sp. JC731]